MCLYCFDICGHDCLQVTNRIITRQRNCVLSITHISVMSRRNCCVIQFSRMAKTEKVDAELFFSALADKTRLRLLNLMRDGEVCVCFFAGTLSTNNPKISRHLSYLKRAGLVEGRRDGK